MHHAGDFEVERHQRRQIMSSGERREGARWMIDLRKTLQALWHGEILWSCPMAGYSTIKAGGPAAALIEPRSMAELAALVRGLHENRVKWMVLGGGSNVLVADEGFAGVVLHLGRRFGAIAEAGGQDGSVLVTVEAGCSLARLVNWCLERELAGLEFASGIPGSIGGAVVMNAGAWGREIGSLVEKVTVVDGDGNIAGIEGASIPFRYRSWGLAEQVVAAVTLRLEKGRRQEIEAACHELARRRRGTQPLDKPSAGSFFKNPPAGPAAGKLIEDAGLKGYRIGDAMVSPKHANFIVNMGHASAADLLALMDVVREKVMAMSGIWLEPEVRIIGDRKG